MTHARLKKIRNLLWLYFWLLIFEGALRKWILPGLSNPLLLVRDPLALWALILGWPLLQQQHWRRWVQPLFLIGPSAFLLTMTLGHGDLFTALYGLRVFVLQLPLIFLFASVFDRADVIRFAWVVLWLSIPMTILLAIQSGQPESSYLNVGPGGVGTAMFQGALGRSRPAGTFSFISGVATFYGLAASSLFLLLYNTRLTQRGRLFCTLAGIALVVALPVSISRSLLSGYIMVVMAVVVALALSRSRLQPLFSGLVALTLAIGIATTIPAFQDTSAAFLARWEDAGAAGGADREQVGDLGVTMSQVQVRVIPTFTGPFDKLARLPMLGYGIGMGSNVGAQRLGNGQLMLMGEGGWEVSLGELGILLGLAFVIWRIALALWILRVALRAASGGNQLPLIIAGSSLLTVMIGQLSQPTGLGFVVLLGGLTLAARNLGTGQAF